MNKYTDTIRIKDLLNIDYKYRLKLDDKILKNYSDIIKLCANYNTKITDINHMTKLKVLHAYGQWRNN